MESVTREWYGMENGTERKFRYGLPLPNAKVMPNDEELVVQNLRREPH